MTDRHTALHKANKSNDGDGVGLVSQKSDEGSMMWSVDWVQQIPKEFKGGLTIVRRKPMTAQQAEDQRASTTCSSQTRRKRASRARAKPPPSVVFTEEAVQCSEPAKACATNARYAFDWFLALMNKAIHQPMVCKVTRMGIPKSKMLRKVGRR